MKNDDPSKGSEFIWPQFGFFGAKRSDLTIPKANFPELILSYINQARVSLVKGGEKALYCDFIMRCCYKEMTVNKIITKLQILMKEKFPHYDGKFYANRRNAYIHLGLDNSLFSFNDYKEFLYTINKFLSEHLKPEFKSVDPPKLVISTKWKHDYNIRSPTV